MAPSIYNIFILTCSLIVLMSKCPEALEDRQAPRKFPEGFLFGAATSSYQVEGGWNANGKVESVWDYYIHKNPETIKDFSNGDVAADSYNQYKRDVEMIRELGLDFYRFSISWPRLLPTSFPDKINEAGVQYYNNLIDELLKYNIQPMVTLFHWDLPQKLQEMGGWVNPHIVDWFTDYVRVVFDNFGDRVKYWITINEPMSICHYAYGEALVAPAVHSPGIAEYICSKNLLLAHAKAFHLYDKVYRPTQNGNISITIHSFWDEPETVDDIQIANDSIQFVLGHYAHPIFTKTGGFPKVMIDRIAAKSHEQGFPRSRLPELSSEEIEMIRGSSDFFGLNHYTSRIVRKNQETIYHVPSYFDDTGAFDYQPDDWIAEASDMFKVTPWGFYKILMWIKAEYDNPPIIVTENGFSSRGGLQDDDRVDFFKSYLNAMLDAISDGANVVGYTAWSLMDNFEWINGYTERFGLYEVNYESSVRTRTPRKSAFLYKNIVRSRALNLEYEPDTSLMTIDEGH
ncbi:hypothetical protein ACJJTC_011860 [Scirpophaga incertulas]